MSTLAQPVPLSGMMLPNGGAAPIAIADGVQTVVHVMPAALPSDSNIVPMNQVSLWISAEDDATALITVDNGTAVYVVLTAGTPLQVFDAIPFAANGTLNNGNIRITPTGSAVTAWGFWKYN